VQRYCRRRIYYKYQPRSRMKKLFALRGAVCCENNSADITEKVCRLYDMLLSENSLVEEHIVSIVFSVTDDISAKNPAAALRGAGRAKDAALFVCAEAAFQDSPESVVRVLLHCYMDEQTTPKHIYINGAEKLRPDRAVKLSLHT
jgi:chorismate mutase